MASNSSKENEALAQQFVAITGSTAEIGTRLLEACNYDLEMAIGMHIDTGGSGDPTDTGASCSDAACGDEKDDVRAPIPQKREVLVEEEGYGYSFGFRGRRRPRRTVFDAFRDFEAETRQQEMAISENVPTAVTKKRKTLEDLFRPPIDLMHRGSFFSARDAGNNTNRWLLVNIQNVQEFSCQALNRDVWSNNAAKSIIREHFVFWQVYHDSEEGQKFSQFYKVEDWPYIAVLDPRTGEKLVEWSQVNAGTFCDLVSQFLASHPAPDQNVNSPLHPAPDQNVNSPPPKRVKRGDSIVDAHEDSQLAAAIKASLEETVCSTEKTVVTIDCESDNTDDYNLETFSDSDNDDDSPSSPEKSQNKSLAKTDVCKSPIKRLSGKSLNSEDNTLTSDIAIATSCKNTEFGKKSIKGKALVSKSTNHSNGSVKESEDCSRESENLKEGWKKYLGSEEDPKSSIVVRFADGKKEQFVVPCSSQLMALVQFVIERGYSNERYELVTNYPRRKLSYMDFDLSLKDIGLFPQETVFVQER